MIVGITGSNGFIGKALVEKLQKQKDTCNVKIFNGDVLNFNQVDVFARDCNKIIHLAGILSNDFNNLIEVNVKGTRNIVDACRKNGIEKMIFASTGAVYGEPFKNGISFENDPLTPNTLYGLSKFYAEEYIRFSKIDCVILRFPNVYGPDNNKGVIYNFLESIQKEKKVNIFGTGKQKRNFLYVNDAAEAIVKTLGYRGSNKVFNIADNKLYSLNDVVEKLKNRGLKFDIEYRLADEINQLQILSENIELAKNELGWEPIVTLDLGIERIITKNYQN